LSSACTGDDDNRVTIVSELSDFVHPDLLVRRNDTGLSRRIKVKHGRLASSLRCVANSCAGRPRPRSLAATQIGP